MIVRELITKIGFRVNESQFRAAESRITSMQRRMQNFGLKASLFLTAPFVALNIWMGKTLSLFEQLDVSFQTMIGNTEDAKKLVEDMLQFAAKTPFEVKEIGNVVKQLLATGSSVETVIDDLRILGNAAAGVNVPISRLALNFGQVRAQGKLTGRELRDFAVAGINVRKGLAKDLGVTTEAIADMTSRGEISFKQLREVFVSMSSEGGMFNNLMIKQSKTLGGLWSNFKDILTLAVRDFSQDLLPLFKKIVLGLTKIVDVFKNQLSPTMKRMLWFLGLFLGLLGPVTLALWAFVAVGKAVTTTLFFIAGAAKAANMSLLLFLGKFVLIAVGILGTLSLAAALFEDIFTFMKDGESATGRIIALLDKLNAKLKSLGVFTINFLKRIFKNISGILDGFFEGVIGLFTGRWKFAINGLIKFLSGSLKLIANSILLVFQPVFDVINAIFKTKIDLGKAMDKVISGGVSVATQYPSFSRSVGEKIAGFPDTARMIAEAAIRNASGGFATSPMMGNISNFNINSNITLPVPEGTPSEQIEAVDTSARKAVDEQFRANIRDLVMSMPEKE